MSQDNKEVVRAAWEAWNPGDTDAFCGPPGSKGWVKDFLPHGVENRSVTAGQVCWPRGRPRYYFFDFFLLDFFDE